MAAGPGGAGGTGIALTGVRASQWEAAEGGPERRRANRRRRPAGYKYAEGAHGPRLHSMAGDIS